jgi:hypothetical protein
MKDCVEFCHPPDDFWFDGDGNINPQAMLYVRAIYPIDSAPEEAEVSEECAMRLTQAVAHHDSLRDELKRAEDEVEYAKAMMLAEAVGAKTIRLPNGTVYARKSVRVKERVQPAYEYETITRKNAARTSEDAE